jgi:hypothetical protein
VRSEIAALVAQSTSAWNRGDLDAFMVQVCPFTLGDVLEASLD